MVCNPHPETVEFLARLPSMAICKAETKNAIFRFLHFQWLSAIENGGSSLNRTALAIMQEPLCYFHWETK